MDAKPAPSPPEWMRENRLGIGFARSGQWSDAVSAFERALACLPVGSEVSQPHGDGLAETRALLFSNISQAYLRCGRPDVAQRYAEEALSFRIATFGEDAPSVALTRNNLAVVLCSQGRAAEAVSMLDHAIASIESHARTPVASLAQLKINVARIRKLAATDSTHIVDDASVMDYLPAIDPAFDHSVGSDSAVNDFDLVEPPPATLNEFPVKNASASRANPLGFDVEYGIPREHHEPLKSGPTSLNED